MAEHDSKTSIELLAPSSDADSSEMKSKPAPSPSVAAVFGPALPDMSFDITGDGQITAKDYGFALRVSGNRYLDELEPHHKDEAKKLMEMSYPKGYLRHPNWAELEELVWEVCAYEELKAELEKDETKVDEEVMRQTVVALFMAAAQAGAVHLLAGLYNDYKPHMEARNQLNQTALLMAMDFSQYAAAKWLLQHGADTEVIDKHGNTPMGLALQQRVAFVKVLITHGAKLSLDMFLNALDVSLDSNAYTTAGFLFAYNHTTMNTSTFIKRLFKLEDTERRHNKEFNPQSFFKHCKKGLALNRSPLAGSLKMAAVFKGLEEKMRSERHVFHQMASSFTRQAVWLWNQLDSDVVASLVLEQEPLSSVDGAPLEIALESENTEFVVNQRLDRIVSSWWQPYPFDATWFTNDAGEIFRTPVVKFWMDAVSYAIFLVLFSMYTTSHTEVNDSITQLEMLLLFFGIAYGGNEFQQMVSQGFAVYWAEVWNRFDLSLMAGVVVLTVCRGPQWGEEQLPNVRVFYQGTVIAMIMAMWLRALFLFTGLPGLGPLVITLKKMIMDVLNFAVLNIMFVIGFFFAFDFLAQGNFSSFGDVRFSDTRSTLLTLVQDGMAGETLKEFDALDNSGRGRAPRVYAEILGTFYQLITGVVLVNLLIAMMGNTFQEVKDNSDAEFVFSNVLTMWRYDQSTNDLPPPLNLVVYVIFVPVWILDKVLVGVGKGLCGIKLHGDYCGYCHSEWLDGEVPQGLHLTDSALTRFPELTNFSFHRTKDSHKQVVQLYRDGVICRCVRMKKLISGDRYLLERISQLVFAVVIFLPTVAVSFLLFLSHNAIQCCTNASSKLKEDVDEDEEEDFLKVKDMYDEFRDPLNAFNNVKVPDEELMTDSEKLDRLLGLLAPEEAADRDAADDTELVSSEPRRMGTGKPTTLRGVSELQTMRAFKSHSHLM